MEVLVGGEIRNVDLEQVVEGTGHVMARDNLRQLHDRLLPRRHGVTRVTGEPYSHKYSKPSVQGRGSDLGAVPENDAVLLQPADSTKAGRCRKANGYGKIGIAYAAISFQNVEDRAIDIIHGERILRAFRIY